MMWLSQVSRHACRRWMQSTGGPTAVATVVPTVVAMAVRTTVLTTVAMGCRNGCRDNLCDICPNDFSNVRPDGHRDDGFVLSAHSDFMRGR